MLLSHTTASGRIMAYLESDALYERLMDYDTKEDVGCYPENFSGNDYLQRNYKPKRKIFMEVVQGRIKKPYGKQFESKFNPGQYQCMLVVELEDGTEEKIYGAPDQMPHAALQRGDACQLLFEEKNGKYIRRLLDATGSPKRGAAPAGRQPAQHRRGQSFGAAAAPAPVASQYPSKPVEPQDATAKVKSLTESLANTVLYLEHSFTEAGYPDVPFEELRNMAVSIFINLDRSIRGDFVVKAPHPAIVPAKEAEIVPYEEEEEYEEEDPAYYGDDDEDPLF